MNWYQCRKCQTLVKNAGTPSSATCPKGGTHTWDKLGEVGDTNYQCRKCSITVQTKTVPMGSNCPSGGSHTWNKL